MAVNLMFIGCTLTACQGVSDSCRAEVERLNHRAYNQRYTHLDSVQIYAQKALRLSGDYAIGRAEAYNSLGFAAYMRQDFGTARKYYDAAAASTNNQLELLMTDVGLMKVYQRQGENKLFYDCYTHAATRITRLQEENDVLSNHDRERLVLAKSEFYLASSIYYYYMQQEDKSAQELERINPSELEQTDTIQWAYYLYMLGSGGMIQTASPQNAALQEFDYLLRSYIYSRERGISYLEGNILQSLSEHFTDSAWATTVLQGRRAAVGYFNPDELPDSLLPTYLAQESLKSFERFGDLYQISSGHRTLASAYFHRKLYHRAMDELVLALKNVNDHSRRYNRVKTVPNQLPLYAPDDSLSVELQWLGNDSISTVPEWVARIREQLSLTFSALGNKPASDYNRNIYLDILDRTRQDKEWESRYDTLASDSRTMSLLFVVVGVLITLGITLFVYLNRRWRLRYAVHIERLNRAALLCRQITQSVPADAEDEEQLIQAIKQATDTPLQQLFGSFIRLVWMDGRACLQIDETHRLTDDEASLVLLIQPYLDWAVQNGSRFILLADEHKQLEKELFLHEQHLADNKRQNIEKRACLSIVTGMTPYLDRIINELNKLSTASLNADEKIKYERYQYIDELVDRINNHNDILASWIKMKQGILSLHIENFALKPLFDIVGKGHGVFVQKGLTLHVQPTEAVVKADKALTLFMINTLVENARKYSDAGATVTLQAQITGSYVEIAVEDTGRGLSPDEVTHLINEKVYDAKKGYGFGLMNCKGIIEKYRKTNSLFAVCSFNIRSVLGKGSRFSFRLPCGVLRLLALIILLAGNAIGTSSNAQTKTSKSQADSLLYNASRYADSTYYSNVDGCYEAALLFADSACMYLNRYYQQVHPGGKELMSMEPGGRLAELAWWRDSVPTDFHVVLDIRNEAAVASLALRKWQQYRTNNEGYTRLYKLLGQDNTLSAFCKEMQTSAGNRSVALTLLIVFFLFFLIAYYVIYFRHRQLYRINLQQALEANTKALEACYPCDASDATIQQLPLHILNAIYSDLNNIHSVQAIALLIVDSEGDLSEIACTQAELLTPLLRNQLSEVIATGKHLIDSANRVHIYPLQIERQEGVLRVGAFAFIRPDAPYQTDDEVLNSLVLSYVAIVVYQTVVRLSHKQVDLELVEDEKRKAEFEENRIHVQNMMLDNCLSSLKHETMYYPNRIKQIVTHLQRDAMTGNEAETGEQITAMKELMDYYKSVFGVLSLCAARQLEAVHFSREEVLVDKLLFDLNRYFNKLVGKRLLNCMLQIEAETELVVKGDADLLRFMLENLVDESIENLSETDSLFFAFSAEADGMFVRFRYRRTGKTFAQEELNQLFYVDKERMKTDEKGNLRGTQFLICRQIIREHDDMMGHPGCRINANPLPGGGYELWFTLPIKK